MSDPLSVERIVLEYLFKNKKINVREENNTIEDDLNIPIEKYALARKICKKLPQFERNIVTTKNTALYTITEKGEKVLQEGIPEYRLYQAVGSSAIQKNDVEKILGLDEKSANKIWRSCLQHKIFQFNPAQKGFTRNNNPDDMNNNYKNAIIQITQENIDHPLIKELSSESLIERKLYLEYILQSEFNSVQELYDYASAQTAEVTVPKEKQLLKSLKELATESVVSNQISWKDTVPSECTQLLSLQQSRESFKGLIDNLVAGLLHSMKSETEFPNWKDSLEAIPESDVARYLNSNRYSMSNYEALVLILVHRNGTHKGLKSILKQLVPNHTQHYWRDALCYVYWTLGMPDISEKYFLKRIETFGSDKEFPTFYFCELARMWRHFGNPEKSCFYYSKLEDMNANYKSYSLALQAFCYLEMGNTEMATQRMKSAIEMGYNDQSNLLRYYCQIGDVDAMSQYFPQLEENDSLINTLQLLSTKQCSLFECIWSLKYVQTPVSSVSPYAFRLAGAEGGSDGIVTITYTAFSEPFYPVLPIEISTGRVTKDNLYRWGIVPTVPNGARHIMGRLDPTQSTFPVTLFSNDLYNLVSIVVNKLLHLYWVDKATNTVISYINLPKIMEESSGVIKTMSEVQFKIVKSRYIVGSIITTIGITGAIELHYLVLLDATCPQVVHCIHSDTLVELANVVDIPGQNCMALLLEDHMIAKIKHLWLLSYNGEIIEKVDTNSLDFQILSMHQDLLLGVSTRKAVLYSVVDRKACEIELDHEPATVLHLWKNYYVEKDEDDKQLVVFDTHGKIHHKLAIEGTDNLKMFASEEYVLTTCGSLTAFLFDSQMNVKEIKLPNTSVFSVKFLKNCILLSTIGYMYSELFQLSYEGKVMKTFPLLAAWSYEIWYDEKREMAIITDEYQEIFAFRVVDEAPSVQ